MFFSIERKLFSVLLVLLLFFQGLAYGTNPDSVARLLEEAQGDPARVWILIDQANLLSNSRPDLAEQYAQQALELSEEVDYKEGYAFSLLALGNCMSVSGDASRELNYYLEALPLMDELGDIRGKSDCLNGMGNIYFRQGDVEKATVYYEDAVELRREIGYEKGVAGSLNNLGNIYSLGGEVEKAMRHYREALEINRDLGNRSWESVNLGNIGNMFAEEAKFDSARFYTLEALEIREDLGESAGSAACRNQLGGILMKEGKYSEARQQFGIALGLGQDINARHVVLISLEGLYNVSERSGDYETALSYYKEYSSLRDSVYGQKVATNLASSQAEYEAKQREKEISLKEDLARAEINALESKQSLTTATFIFILIVAVGLGVILIIAFILKQKANENLEAKVEERTQALQVANQELNTFIYKSSHDLRTPLTSILGLVEVARLQGSDPVILDLIAKIGLKVNQLERSHKNLIHAMEIRGGDGRKELVSIQELLDKVMEELKEENDFSELEVELQVDGNEVVNINRLGLEVILFNLLHNSLVFRDSGKESWCRLRMAVEDNALNIEVEDNGIGMEPFVLEKAFEMFFRGDNRSRGSGLGLYNVKLAVEHLDGSIQLKSKAGEGTQFSLHLPLQANLRRLVG